MTQRVDEGKWEIFETKRENVETCSELGTPANELSEEFLLRC